MKRPHLRIIGIEEGEEIQIKGPKNVFNKTIEQFSQPKGGDANKGRKSIPNIKQIGPEKKVPLPHNNQNTVNIQNKERILKSSGGKYQVTYEGRPVRITPERN